MKKRIEEKLEKNIERILGKEELLPSDVAILKEKLSEIERNEEQKEKMEKDEKLKEKKKELMDLMTETLI